MKTLSLVLDVKVVGDQVPGLGCDFKKGIDLEVILLGASGALE